MTLHKVGGELPYEMASEVDWMVRRGRARLVVGLTAEHVATALAARSVARPLAVSLAEQVAQALAQDKALVVAQSAALVTPPVTTSAIAEAAKLLLDPRLHAVIDTRTAEGLAKYGQTLVDANVKSECERAAHLMQELLDAIQYAIWRADPELPVGGSLALGLAAMANELLASMPDLTYAALTFKEGHSRRVAGEL